MVITRPAAARQWPRHYAVVALCFTAVLICYIDRANISVAAIPMKEEFGWTETEKGLVLSSFFVGYILLQAISGAIANRHGGKIVLGSAVVWWSAFTLLTPAAAFASLPVLIATRGAMGLGEGAMFPSAFTMIGRWVPAAQRTRAVAIVLSGVSLGTVLVLPATAALIRRYGWPSAFYISGLLGLVWAAIWFTRVGSQPPADLDPTREKQGAPGPLTRDREASIPWRAILSLPPVWAIIVNHFCNNWSWYMLLSWLPSYFRTTYRLSITTAGMYSSVAFLVLFAATHVVAWIADLLLKRGVRTVVVRKSMQTVHMLGTALFLFLLRDAGSPTVALLLVCGAAAALGFGYSGWAPNAFDIAPRYADVVFGISNTIATIPGIIGVAVTGWLLDTTGTYAAPFLLAASLNVMGAVVFLLFASGRRIIDPGQAC